MIAGSTTVSVKRGTVTGHYGDDLDSDEVVAVKIPATILENPVTGVKPASGRADTVRTYTLRCWRRFAFRQDDRIVDERTGREYVVTTEAPTNRFVGLGSVRLQLQRVT